MRHGSACFFLALAGCSSGETPTKDAPSSGAGGGTVHAESCDVHATTGSTHFTDRTEAWGLAGAARVRGILLSAADLDGDGYPDLLVHRFAPNQRESVGASDHLYRVLMNERAADGRRTFVDRTAESGYGATAEGSKTEYRAAHMAVCGDVDNDGDLDIVSGTYTDPGTVQKPPTAADLDRNEVLLNDGHGHFTLAPSSEVQVVQPRTTSGMTLTDLDRDGVLDLFVVNWFANTTTYPPSPQQMLVGDRTEPGVFHDVSSSAGVTAAKNRRPAFGVTASDLNGDGVPEILVDGYGRTPNILYQSDGPLHYVDVGVASGFAYDDDQGYQDDQYFRCFCTVHADMPTCTGAQKPQVACPSPADANWAPGYSDRPENLGGNTFATVSADFTGDGAFDLYSAEIVHWWAGSGSDPSQLLVNASDPSGIRFTRPGREATGLEWPHVGPSWNEGGLYAAPGDLDNDGRPDLFVGASDYPDQYGLYFHQKPDGTFEEIAEASGLHHACASSPIVADFDRDGDLDVVIGSSLMREWCTAQWPDGEEVHFYESDASQHGHWLVVKLVGDGVTSNTTGVGARVRVHTEGADGTDVVQAQELGGGYGHFAQQNDTVLFFGLGACGAVRSVEVVWPAASGVVETWVDVAADRVVELRQGDAAVHDASPSP